MAEFGTVRGCRTSSSATTSSRSLEIRRPPDNFFDRALIASIADALEALDAEPRCRAAVLVRAGQALLRRRQLPRHAAAPTENGRHLYDEAVRLFAHAQADRRGGAGRARSAAASASRCAPDFRVAAPEARFSANFARLGFHHGFGLTRDAARAPSGSSARSSCSTRAAASTARRRSRSACATGSRRSSACARPRARSPPRSPPRARSRSSRSARRSAASSPSESAPPPHRERAEQERLQRTADFREGVAAMAARRKPNFERR